MLAVWIACHKEKTLYFVGKGSYATWRFARTFDEYQRIYGQPRPTVFVLPSERKNRAMYYTLRMHKQHSYELITDDTHWVDRRPDGTYNFIEVGDTFGEYPRTGYAMVDLSDPKSYRSVERAIALWWVGDKVRGPGKGLSR